MTSISASAEAVERRLQRTGVQIETAIAFIGCLIIIVADAQSLALIPLVSNLEKTYGLSPAQATWSLTTPGIVAAGFVPTLARLGDRFGMRRLLLASLVLSLLANLLCALADSFALLVAGRALLGMSAAFPLVYAILRARGTSEKRTTRGVSAITLASGLGVALAYLLSGLIIQAHGDVRTVFWAMTAMCVVTVLAAWFILPDAPARTADPIDWVGAFGICVGLVGVVLAITEGGTWGWTSFNVMGSLIGGLAILGLWALHEVRTRHPLINLRRVMNRTAAPAFVVVALSGTLAGYGNLAQTTYVQMPKVVGYGLGLSVLASGYVLCVISAGVILGGAVAGPVISRHGPRRVMATGSAVLVVDFLVLAFHHAGIGSFIIWDAVWGVTFAFVYSAANAAFLADSAPSEAAMYVSANTVVSAVGSGIGPAIFVAILTSRTIAHTPIPDPIVFRNMWFVGAVACLVMGAVSLLVRRPQYVSAAEAVGAAEPLSDIEAAPSGA